MVGDGAQGSRPEPPLALRAALDLAAIELGATSGALRARLVGLPDLVAELAAYAPSGGDGVTLLAVGATPAEVRDALALGTPARVLVIADGPLARPGRGGVAPLLDLDDGAWRELGYRRAATWGLQGVGSLTWAVAERLARRAGRPDLADRCKVGMLRALVTAGPARGLATVRVRLYRRVA